MEATPPTDRSSRTTPLIKVITALAIVASLGLFLFAVGREAFACGWDTSYCAMSADKNGVYRGVLQDEDGSPYANGTFSVGFESRNRDHLPDLTFSTDGDGAFCIQWPEERIVPYISPPLQVAHSPTPIHQLADWSPLDSDATVPGCQKGDGGVPWDRADSIGSSWQFWSLIIAPALAFFALIASLVLRGPGSVRLRFAGLACLALAGVLELIL